MKSVVWLALELFLIHQIGQLDLFYYHWWICYLKINFFNTWSFALSLKFHFNYFIMKECMFMLFYLSMQSYPQFIRDHMNYQNAHCLCLELIKGACFKKLGSYFEQFLHIHLKFYHRIVINQLLIRWIKFMSSAIVTIQ